MYAIYFKFTPSFPIAAHHWCILVTDIADSLTMSYRFIFYYVKPKSNILYVFITLECFQLMKTSRNRNFKETLYYILCCFFT